MKRPEIVYNNLKKKLVQKVVKGLRGFFFPKDENITYSYEFCQVKKYFLMILTNLFLFAGILIIF